MKKKLTKIEDRYFIEIDPSILQQMNLSANSEFETSCESNKIIFQATDKNRTEQLNEALKEVNQKYGNTLRRLAE